MKYHLSYDIYINSGTALAQVSYKGKLLAKAACKSEMPKSFQPVGDERSGFNSDEFLKHTDLSKFQYIDKDGVYVTMQLYTHDPKHLENLANLDRDNFLEIETMNHLEEVNSTLGHYHSEFDYIIS